MTRLEQIEKIEAHMMELRLELLAAKVLALSEEWEAMATACEQDSGGQAAFAAGQRGRAQRLREIVRGVMLGAAEKPAGGER